MKSYGLEMQGKFKTETLTSLPAWTAADEGRIVYVNEVLYHGTSSGWSQAGSSVGNLKDIKYITSSGTYTKPSVLSFIIVYVVGGGGSGGGCAANGSQTSCGSGGGLAIKKIDNASIGSSETITIGDRGLGTTGGSNNGGTSSFGSHCSATGGRGGSSALNVNTRSRCNGAAGGSGSGGDINLVGNGTSDSTAITNENHVTISSGGSAPGFGGAGWAGTVATNGNNGRGPGAGGSGSGMRINDTTNVRGGHGSNGIVIIYEYE